MWKIFEVGKERYEILKNYRSYLDKIAEHVSEILGESDIFLFGSILEDEFVAASDVDILIISEIPKSHKKRAEIIASIEEKMNLPLVHPFEIHLLNPEEFEQMRCIYNDLKLEKIN